MATVIRKTYEHPYPEITEVRFFQAGGVDYADLTVMLSGVPTVFTLSLENQQAIVDTIKTKAENALRSHLASQGYTEHEV